MARTAAFVTLALLIAAVSIQSRIKGFAKSWRISHGQGIFSHESFNIPL